MTATQCVYRLKSTLSEQYQYISPVICICILTAYFGWFFFHSNCVAVTQSQWLFQGSVWQRTFGSCWQLYGILHCITHTTHSAKGPVKGELNVFAHNTTYIKFCIHVKYVKICTIQNWFPIVVVFLVVLVHEMVVSISSHPSMRFAQNVWVTL